MENSESPEESKQEGRKDLLNQFIGVTFLYLGFQEFLNFCILLQDKFFKFGELDFRYIYLLTPIISLLLITILYIVLKKFNRDQDIIKYLVLLGWALLVIPQMSPPIIFGLNIIYTTWFLILSAISVGTTGYKSIIRILPRSRDLIMTSLNFTLKRSSSAG